MCFFWLDTSGKSFSADETPFPITFDLAILNVDSVRRLKISAFKIRIVGEIAKLCLCIGVMQGPTTAALIGFIRSCRVNRPPVVEAGVTRFHRNENFLSQLSNYRVYEDRETGEFVLFMARYQELGEKVQTSPSYQYRIGIS